MVQKLQFNIEFIQLILLRYLVQSFDSRQYVIIYRFLNIINAVTFTLPRLSILAVCCFKLLFLVL